MSPKIEQTHEIDPVAPYSKHSKKVFFEYIPGETSFQLGYLGVNKSTVEGILRLRYTDDKPIFAKKITLSFVGKEFVQVTGKLETSQDQGDDESDEEITSSIIKREAKRKLYNCTMVIWRSQSKSHYEGVKNLDLPFKFKLPNNLPPSVTMDKGCGRIYYMLKAIISRKPIDPNSRNMKKMIKYVIPIVRYTITPRPKPIQWLKKVEESYKPHVLGYDVFVTRSVFSPGETVDIPIKLTFHEPHVYLKKIFVGLKEYYELRTNKYSTLIKRYIAEETIQADTIPNFDHDCSVRVKLNMPPERGSVYSVETTYLTVFHKLKVKISLGKAPDINLSYNVKIEKIVSENEIIKSLPTINNDIPKVITTHEPIMVKPKRDSYRRLTPFFPLFSKIENSDLSMKKIQPLQVSPVKLNFLDSKNPNVVYNSRSLPSQVKQQLQQED